MNWTKCLCADNRFIFYSIDAYRHEPQFKASYWTNVAGWVASKPFLLRFCQAKDVIQWDQKNIAHNPEAVFLREGFPSETIFVDVV